MGYEEEVRGFILEELAWKGPAEELTPDYPLIANKVLDSLSLFQLVNFLEDSFGLEIDNDDLTPENFGTLASITKFLETKSSG